MNDLKTISPLTIVRTEPALDQQEEKLVALIAKIIVDKTIQQSNEESNTISQVQQ